MRGTLKTRDHQSMIAGAKELKGNRYVRLDQLVETIHKEVLITQQLFADYVLHKGYAKSRNKFKQLAQRKKTTPTVVSKFKKIKKKTFQWVLLFN